MDPSPELSQVANERLLKILAAATFLVFFQAFGLGVAALSGFLLAPDTPVGFAAAAVGLLSLDYDLTQPLLAGIVTQLSTNRGQAMGFNVFTLFTGFGTGSLVFQLLPDTSFTTALIAFGSAAVLAGIAAIPLFAAERRPGVAPTT